MLSEAHLRFGMFNFFRLGFHIVHYYSLQNILMNLDETKSKLEDKAAFHSVDGGPGW